MRTEKIGNCICWIGQNAEDNWKILEQAEDGYYFFHLSSFPSCYVILATTEPSQEEIQKSAEACKRNTKYRNMKNVHVDYTKISNVEKGDDLGEVLYKSLRKVQKIKL